MFEHPNFSDHEAVLHCRNPDAGLMAIIAIHSTALGPAAGGCRMWPYASSDEALTDVLRLSRAMTWKNALAGLPLGGGKSVIIGDPGSDKNPQLLRAFAQFVNTLQGRYWTAEDVGIGISDAEVLADSSEFVFGISKSGSGSGDPSRFTARGVYQGIRAAVQHALKREQLSGVSVAVQGVGNVGYELCKMLAADNAKLIVSDVNESAIARVQAEMEATVVAPDRVHAVKADVYSPCAMGGILNPATIEELQVSVVAGAANNQLESSHDGDALRKRGVVYAPDFVINAGGMHNAARDILSDYGVEKALHRIDGIFDLTLQILATAEKENRSTDAVAEVMAKRVVQRSQPGQ